MRTLAGLFLVFAAVLAGCGSAGSGAEVSGFVKLGPLTGKAPVPVELTGDEGQRLYRTLSEAASADIEEAKGALTAQPDGEGVRSFAFVKPGCMETGAEAVVSDGTVDVELTGGENVNCAQANYFLVVVRADDPEGQLRLAG
ncbi:hypothetical protein BAY61_05355 [Prauserella marina]|uniref:Uncharacterized protein n=1 Tax=Prauserella marina TaxID=530584 RepID=A0A222VLC9_9PSEU|nr:hypothetical protein [Prauserella marina]ASR34511.1 hypothetical protein BAY61_05355 [Prauserella marina]PWV85887.1 hypothetical protein DES30_1011917 [Prauserella marina]SDC43093.1 hypothetical protein SAMN05421630_10275 [Prauserella marina]